MIFGWVGRMRSFGDKVTWLVTLTSGAAIVAVCFALAVVNYGSLRRETLASLESQTMIVAMNSSAPLAFADVAMADEALAAFQARPAVALATLYDVNGGRFASYRRQVGLAPESPAALPEGALMQRWYRHVSPVQDHGQSLGRIEVIFDLRDLHQHLWRTLGLSALVSIIAVLLVYLFSLRINQVLVKPIALLNQAARQVSETKNYSLRARKVSSDELGEFTDTFNQMLEQIQKQDLQIQASRAEALHASQLKDEFLATLSHELRTPMTPILGWAQILQRSARDNPQVLQAAEVIERNARAQNRIVDDLLDMSRIISGKVRLDVQPMDMAEVVAQALDTVMAAAQARGVAVRFDHTPGSGLTHGDPHRLQQVVWNLLSNAIKFTGSGGRVTIVLRREPSRMLVAITDTGQGIGPEFLPHVFERFRQADSSDTRQHSGLGLGLAIVKQLVELHGGSVHATSPGEQLGSTFTVVLPAVPAGPTVSTPDAKPAAPPAAAAPAVSGSLAGTRVLLVDDEADARELIAHVLRSQGAEVTSAESAEMAITALLQFPFDALISDIGMPVRNGYDLIREVRAMPADAGGSMPAIALTAFARPEDHGRALLEGFQMHLAKPVEHAALLSAVRRLTGQGG